ncbi:MAG: glycoside hydrolase family 43 protein [Pseudobutyrivibrio sp.]|nr:glycoside hydrolase family 43 protein [Pseudobutyrivibrio sp.]
MNYKLQNPVIPGYYPDPSIIRVGDDFYLACSSFEMSPGLPIFHSKDLAHWEQIANAIGPENGLHMEKNSGVGGLMAPTLRYNDGTYYIINTNFADKGNYIITAKDPAGPWSEPHWLDDVPGIDASFFFDNDGKCYVMGTGECWDNGAGKMERGIWLAEFDIENFKLKGEPFTIFNSGMRNADSPEAPHLYHIGDYYYLMIAEGGTEHYHSVVVARSKELFSFFEGNPANPVLTHRHMGYRCPITNVGHADWVQLKDGSWYAVFLASRLIDGKSKNLGRETFICPVVWERDWPLFSPETGKVEWSYDGPESLKEHTFEKQPSRVDFDSEKLPLNMVSWGNLNENTWSISDSKLTLKCIHQMLADDIRQESFEVNLSDDNYVAFLGERQCAVDCTATCQMSFMPNGQETAGLAIVQAMNHQLHIERALSEGKQVLRAVLVTADYDRPPYFPGFSCTTNRQILGEVAWDSSDIILQLNIKGEDFTIKYGSDENSLQELCKVDGSLINPEKVGCMTGTLIGMFATGNGEDIDNHAEFDWFEIR